MSPPGGQFTSTEKIKNDSLDLLREKVKIMKMDLFGLFTLTRKMMKNELFGVTSEVGGATYKVGSHLLRGALDPI